MNRFIRVLDKRKSKMELSMVNNDYYLSGMAALIGDIDSKINRIFLLLFCNKIHIQLEQLMVILRDGRTLIAFLRSLDQFGRLNSFE